MENSMVPLEKYKARDRRVYYGALCSDMQLEEDRLLGLRERMRAANKYARCVNFIEDGYMVFVKDRPLTNNFHMDEQDALIEAIKVLEKGE